MPQWEGGHVMNKCIWCYKKSYDVKEVVITGTSFPVSKRRDISLFVCPEHEERLRRFYDRVRRYGFLFIGLIVICLIVFIGAICWRVDNNYLGPYLFTGSFAVMGAVIFIFPFCSQTTFDLMSIATAIKVTRIMGVVIFALGTAGLVFALLYE